jgi:pseudouridine synthase
MDKKIRLQKIIAAAGLASRREAERLIQDGRVTVNGKVVTDLGIRVDPEENHIKVRGKLIQPPKTKTYLALNKPAGYVSTHKDPQGRPTVLDLIHGVRERVFVVGRLDFNSEGLILLTNDGELANALMHPKYHVSKTYQVKVKGHPDASRLQKLSRGIQLADGPTKPVKIEKVRYLKANTTLEITLYEGRKRQIRRMFEKIGHPVLRLKRVRIGPIRLSGLSPGKFIRLNPWQIKQLKDDVSKKSK